MKNNKILHLSKSLFMRLFLIAFLLLILSRITFAQDIPMDTLLSSTSQQKEELIKQKLVSLALNNPDLKVLNSQIAIAKHEAGSAKADWLNYFSASGNLNEFSLNPSQAPVYNVYPRYNFSVNIPLGSFFKNADKVKAAKQNIIIAQQQKASKIRDIKTAVLEYYEDYMLYSKEFTMQSQLVENTYNLYLQQERKFRNGSISIEDYNTSFNNYNNSLTNKLKLQHDMDVAKLNLEGMIGTSLEDVIRSAQ